MDTDDHQAARQKWLLRRKRYPLIISVGRTIVSSTVGAVAGFCFSLALVFFTDLIHVSKLQLAIVFLAGPGLAIVLLIKKRFPVRWGYFIGSGINFAMLYRGLYRDISGT